MQKKIGSLLILSLGFSTLIYAHDDWSLNNQVVITGEVVYMKRNPLGTNHTIVQETPCPQPPEPPCICPPCEEPKPAPPPIKDLVGTRNLLKKTDFEVGYRLGILYSPSQCRSVEASYLNVDEWHSEITKCGDCCNLRFPFCPSNCNCNFINAQMANLHFSSNFQTAEANYWEHVTPRRCNYFSYSWIAGFRYIDLDESLNIAFMRAGDRSTYSIKTSNDLYGGQFGLNIQVNPYPRWSWDFTLKGGIFANDAHQRTFLGDFNNRVALRDYGKSKTVAAYMGDGSVTLTAQLWNHLNIHIGYEGIYLANLSLATEQLDKRCAVSCCEESKQKMNTKGDAFIQGGFAGIGIGF